MMRCILLLALVGVVAARGQMWPPCRCSPEQWESMWSGTIAYAPAQGPPGVETMFGDISFDSTNNRVFAKQYYPELKMNIHIVQDLEKKIQHVIHPDNKTCNQEPLPAESFGRCIPDDATFIARLTYGLEEAFAYDVYTLQSSGISVGIASKSCVPIFLTSSYVSPDKTSTMQNFGYTNVTAGIKDPSVFDLPSYCNSVEKFNMFKPEIGHIESHLRMFQKLAKN